MKTTNLSKIRRDKMISFLDKLKETNNDDESIKALNEIENQLKEKKFGLVFEEHIEEVDKLLEENIPIFTEDKTKKICKDKTLPYNFIIEGDNLQVLYLLEKTHRGKVDCIYIDPPYNSGARDWKYNNDYVDGNDAYRHSKWLSMMKVRLELAKTILNPKDSVLICTIDEKEYTHLGCLLEEIFPEANIQMISSVINVKGTARDNEFARVNEYIYCVRLGNCGVSPLPLHHEWLGNVRSSGKNKVRLAGLMRSGTGSGRNDSPGCFYPIIVSESGKFIRVGEVLEPGIDRNTYKVEDGEVAIWPIHKDGSEGRWMYRPDGLKELIKKGYVYFGKLKDGKMGINYAPRGVQKKIESGEFIISGYNENGEAIIDDSNYVASYIPGNQWAISSHNATEYGTKLLTDILGESRFTFPKSLYAVHDVLNFFVSNKPNAIIVDFFAGSGTTLHAVNLLNAEDNGSRKCILVTNNEVSENEAAILRAKGYKPGDTEWEELGIAKSVTWARTLCSIEGKDLHGNKLSGNYGIETEEYIENNKNLIISKDSGKEIKTKLYIKKKVQLYPLLEKINKSDGFKSNVKYFKCDWTPRKPEDYLLSNVLLLHIKEMIELQNFIEVDNVKNVIIYNKDDYNKFIVNKERFDKIENLWINQNIIFNSEELNKLSKKEVRYIPKEYFGQELKEAAE